MFEIDATNPQPESSPVQVIDQSPEPSAEESAEVSQPIAPAEVSDAQQAAEDQPVTEVKPDSESPEKQPEAFSANEMQLFRDIASCNRAIEAAQDRIETLTAEIKEEKEILKGEQLRLLRFARRMGNVVDRQCPADSEGDSEHSSTDASADYLHWSESTDWRVRPTSDLIDGVKGIGDKKVEALVAMCPTVGDLEDLRGQASKQHKSFQEVLPEGFGEKAAQQMEDRLIDHIAQFPAEEEPAAEEATSEESQPELPAIESPVSDEAAVPESTIAGSIEDREREQIQQVNQDD